MKTTARDFVNRAAGTFASCGLFNILESNLAMSNRMSVLYSPLAGRMKLPKVVAAAGKTSRFTKPEIFVKVRSG